MLSIVHLYADAYGYTRDYVLDHIYLDEHILWQKIIRDEQRSQRIIDINMTLLPHIDDKKRQQLIKDLIGDQDEPADRGQIKQKSLEETERDIEEAKRQLANM